MVADSAMVADPAGMAGSVGVGGAAGSERWDLVAGLERIALASVPIWFSARTSRSSMRACHPASLVSVCAALLIRTWIRGRRRCSSSAKISTDLTSESSRGPQISSRSRQRSKSSSPS